MRIALYQPDIPHNTGTILRLAACLEVPVDLIGPAGFEITDKALKRAGLDYLEHAALTRHASWERFEEARRAQAAVPRLVLLSARAPTPYVAHDFAADDILLFGRESAGVPETVHATADVRLTVPVRAGLRSLNLAVCVGMVVGEALRQTRAFPSGGR